MSYKIVRLFFKNDRRIERKYTIRRGLTLEEVQAHCRDPETSSSTCKKPVNVRRTRKCGDWFDAYTEDD
jgi:hypothetical protein